MQILFTGGSSFTGCWFIQQLIAKGHHVTAIFRHGRKDYKDVRKLRIEQLNNNCEMVFNCAFGDEQFFELIQKQPKWDLLCHHAADVTNYKSSGFNFSAALHNNTNNIKTVLELLATKQCRKVLLTGSVFEQREGLGSDDLRAVSPYGLSKGLTSDVFQYYCQTLNLSFGKFVIPNPYGPYEENRFTTYLARSWLKGEVPVLNAGEYIRDNVPVSLLAKSYASFASQLPDASAYQKINPSYFPEAQKTFVALFAEEIRKRFELPCEYSVIQQIDFPEPKIRINTDIIDTQALGWDEKKAWDDLATYYKMAFQKG